MIHTFWFVRLCEGEVYENVAWKLQKCCRGWKEVMEIGSRFANILDKGSRMFISLACPLMSLSWHCWLGYNNPYV